MISLLAVVLIIGLASYRLTRVVTTDTITEAARDRLYRWAWVDPKDDDYDETHPDAVQDGNFVPYPRAGGSRTYVNELFNCPWCFGWWVTLALTAAWCWLVRDGSDVVRAAFVFLAACGVQGFIASRRDA